MSLKDGLDDLQEEVDKACTTIDLLRAERNRLRLAVKAGEQAMDMVDTLRRQVTALQQRIACYELKTPHPKYCSQPDRCAGHGHCPRDPTCID